MTAGAVGLFVLIQVARFRPEYEPLCTALSMVFGGVLTVYWTLTVPVGTVDRINEEESNPLYRIPKGGPHVRKYVLVIGVIVLIMGLVHLVRLLR